MVYASLYTSLYPSLQPEHIDRLEQAICAFSLKRFDKTQAIYDDPGLPPSHTIPVLALERARAYSDQGLARESVALLTKALEWNEELGGGRVQELMRLKLRQSRIIAYGHLHIALEEARRIRGLLLKVPLEKYTDIDVALVQAYYQIMHIGRSFSSWVDDSTDGRFLAEAEQNQPWSGISRLRKFLQQSGRYYEALSVLYLAERTFNSNVSLLRDLDLICDAIEASGDLVSTMETRVFLYKRLASSGLGEMAFMKVFRLRQHAVVHLGQDSIANLDHAIEVANFAINHPRENRTAQLLKFADTAHRLGDYLDERANLIPAAEELLANRLYETLNDIISRIIDFELNTTRSALFLAKALSEVGTRSCRVTQRQSEFLELFNDFDTQFPGFDVPICKHGLYSLAADAARSLNSLGDLPRLQDSTRSAFAHLPLPVLESAGNEVEREIFNQEPSSWIQCAVGMVIRWIKKEVELGFTTSEEAKEILGLTGNNSTCRSLASSTNIYDILAAINVDEFTGELYGTSKATPARIWNPRFSRIEEWLRKDGYPWSIEARHSLLLMLQQQRVASRWDMETIPCLVYERKKLLAIHRSIVPAPVEGSPRLQAAVLGVVCSVFELSMMPSAVTNEVVTDKAMVESIALLEESLSQFRRTGWTFALYHYLMIMAVGLWQRYYNFGSHCDTIDPPQPTACLPYLLEADEIYCEVRRERSISKPSTALGAKQKLADEFAYYDLCNIAFNATFEAYMSQKLAHPAQNEILNMHLVNFLEWTQRLKGRGLTDILGFGARIPDGMMVQARRCRKASEDLDNEKQLVDRIESATLDQKLHLREQLRNLRQDMRANPALEMIMHIRDGSSMTMAQIQALGTELGEKVVFVEWVQVVWRDQADLLMVLYKNGCFLAEAFVELKLEDVERWVCKNLNGDRPLLDNDSNLSDMAGLIAPLKHHTDPDEMLVLCPTGVLHRVPLHAINLNQEPLILRNPIAYTQSLSMLRLCLMGTKSGDPADQVLPGSPLPRAVVVHPLPDSHASTESINDIAKILDATQLLHGSVKRASFLDAAANASLLHYHGHVLQRSILLEPEDSSEEAIVRAEAIFDLPLTKPALVTLISCFSNEAIINKSDDLYGIPTALHCAGATSVVSTLWPIDDIDGSEFSKAFYVALDCQVEEMAKNEILSLSEPSSMPIINLATAIQGAVKMIMADKQGPYHWASFVLSGMWRWRVPKGMFTGEYE